MSDDAEQDNRRKRGKKYGGWAWNLSDTEAEEIVHNYGDIAYLFKRIIEDVFGKKYSYVVQDTEWHGDSFTWHIFPEGNRFLDEIAITFGNPTNMIAQCNFEVKQSLLDCEFDELLTEIDEESSNWDYGDPDVPWKLNTDTSDCFGEDECYAACWVHISAYHSDSGNVFQDLPTVDELYDYFERIKEIIDSHKKKTTKKGS